MLRKGEKQPEKAARGEGYMGIVLDTVGQWIASYLQKEVPGYEPFTPSDPDHLRGVIDQGDVLLVEATTGFPASSNI